MSTTGITLRCYDCGHPIHRWAGCVCVDALAAQNEPSIPVPWQAFHYHCGDHLDHSVYWFDVSRLEPTADLIDWAVQYLAAKDWFAFTDWPVFAAKAA